MRFSIGDRVRFKDEEETFIIRDIWDNEIMLIDDDGLYGEDEFEFADYEMYLVIDLYDNTPKGLYQTRFDAYHAIVDSIESTIFNVDKKGLFNELNETNECMGLFKVTRMLVGEKL